MYQHLDDLVLDGFIDLAEHNGQMVNTAGVLPDYPLVDQLHEPTADGLADENARFNCVPASDAGIVKFLCKPNHQDVNGDFLKDKAYGQGSTGGGAQERYIPIIEQLYGVGTTIWRNTDRAALLKQIIINLDAGHPTMITMPSAWNSQPTKAGYNPNSPNFPTHAGTAFGYNPTTKELLVANPWGGFIHRGSYQYWIDRLCYAKVYEEFLIGAGKMPLPTGWKDDGRQLTQNQTQFVVVKGFRDLILNAPYWASDDVPINNEHVLGADEVLELSNPAYGQGDKTRVQQRFRKSWLAAREQANGVWVTTAEWVGVEADFLRHEVDRLNAIIAAAPPPHELTSQEAYDKVGADLKKGGFIQ